MQKPNVLPQNPKFAVGPTAKRPGYLLANLNEELLGRNHRCEKSRVLLKSIVQDFKLLLKIPESYKVILTPASDTGALELALWNIAGSNDIDCLAWDAFGYLWVDDLKNEMKLKNVNIFQADYGDYPNLDGVDFANHDILFTHCGTTSGVSFQHIDLIPDNRKGLVISDATSYVFSEDIKWNKIDVLTLSWQKSLGGEAQTGMLVLSPRAIERINSYSPTWPIPQIFRIKMNGKIRNDLLDTGSPINTISLLSCIDIADTLNWLKHQDRGIEFCYNQINNNFNTLKTWVENSLWVTFLSKIPRYSSKLSVCLKIIHPNFLKLNSNEQGIFLDKMFDYFEDSKIAYDIRPYRKAPLGLRIWCGPTINNKDLEILTHWIEWYLESYCT